MASAKRSLNDRQNAAHRPSRLRTKRKPRLGLLLFTSALFLLAVFVHAAHTAMVKTPELSEMSRTALDANNQTQPTDSVQATHQETSTDSAHSTHQETSTDSYRDSYRGVVSPWTSSGYFSSGDKELDAEIKKLCDELSVSGASYSENAFETFLYVAKDEGYKERVNNQSPFGEGWDIEYAKQYFDEGRTGNCFNIAATNEYVMKYFGYDDAEAEPCVIGLQSGNWGDHGLVFVTNKLTGEPCFLDAAMHEDGWMLDLDTYNYDVRNIGQNSTHQGNVDVLFDADSPSHIAPAPGFEP